MNNKFSGPMRKGGAATNDDARKTEPMANDKGAVRISDKNSNFTSKKRRHSNQNNIYTGQIRIGGTAIK